MAISQDDLQISITVDSKGAVTGLANVTKELKDVSKTEKTAQSSLSSLTSTFSKVGSSIIVMNQALQLVKATFNQVSQAISKNIDAYLIQNKAEIMLANSMKLAGDYTDEAFNSFKEFASILQENSTIGDETSLKYLTLAKNLGLTNEMAKNMVKASIELSEATGKELNTSFEGLANTLIGMTRTVAKYAPEVDQMTKSQLQSGEAIALVAKKFNGFSKSSLLTLSGSLTQSSNAFGDLREQIGETLAKLLSLDDIARSQTKLWIRLQEDVKNFRDRMLVLKEDVTEVFSALNVAISKVDFSGIVSQMDKMVVAIMTLGSPVIAASIAPFIKSMSVLATSVIKAAAPLALVAIKFAAIGAGVLIVASAFDILIRNMDKFEKVQEFLVGAFLLSFEYMKKAVLEFTSFILRKFGDMIVALTEAFPDLSSMATVAMDGLVKGQRGLTDAIIESEASLADMTTAFKETAETIDTGFGGKVFDEAMKFAGSFKKALDEIDSKAKDVADSTSNIGGEKEISFKGKLPELFTGDQIENVGTALSETIGSGIATSATSAMSSMSSMLAGPLGLAGAANVILDAINGLLDLIPNLLNKIGDIINKIVDLPNMILNGVKNIGAAIGNYIANFTPNLISVFSELISYFATEFPRIITNSIQTLISKAPKIMSDLIKGAIGAAISMVPMFVAEIVKGLAIAVKMLFSKEFWKEMGDSIVLALKESINELADAFGLNKPFKIDTQAIEETMQQWGRSIANVSEDVFKVLDMEQMSRGFDLADRIGNAINQASYKFGDILKKSWDWIVNGWRGLWNWVEELWSKLWNWVNDKIIQPFTGALTAVFTWINEKVIQPFMNGLSSIFTWINEKVMQPFIGGIKSVFIWIDDNILKPITTTISAIFSGIGNLFNGIFSAFSGIFDKDFSQIGRDIGHAFTSIIDTALSGLKDLVNFFIRMLNGLKIGPVDWRVSAGKLGKWSGQLFPEVDLIPGEISTFQKGGIVEGRAVAKGDSEKNDTILALVSAGEAIIPRSIMSDPFLGAMIRSILDGSTDIRRFADGVVTAGQYSSNFGDTSTLSNTTMRRPQTINAPTNIEVNLEINTSRPIDDNFITSKIIPAIKSNLKKASLNGDFILSQRGIRA